MSAVKMIENAVAASKDAVEYVGNQSEAELFSLVISLLM